MKKKLVKVGKIGVDAGLCWIGDPCYLLQGSRPKSIGNDWDGFCDTLPEDAPIMKSYDYDIGHEGLGCVVSTGYGDGVYDVIAEVIEDPKWGTRIKSVKVVFIK